ncbi:6-hydroxymethylpterin diphosphokinase MptE-like protein [uncultured Treponema sp.]|uniref:6-hydroxymethylpterin diphosphokinase MptE-like protein n=1 Tax=uncultured Treponema sp. TaxID=162155 RepID=UPI0025DD99CD|nr:6-hydroxymethylpterin diphosphokinase MptE-like protein [uncultured Treponema sp.]
MSPNLIFENSKSGELTCCFQGKYLHSKYNPKNEGEKFAANLQADFSPLCIFILEPALSYCAQFLKNRFPNAKICAIRYCKDFSQTDYLWDKVFYLEKQNIISLEEVLFNALGEELLISSLAFDWQPSKSVFPEESFEVWSSLKKAILKARDVIGTRAYFSKRWLKNSLIFAKNINYGFTLEKGDSPVIIAASGPSLKSSLPYLKKYRDSFFLIALSSAFMPLSKNGIQPDILISSDGGFWAKKHLAFPGNASKPFFALEAESAAPIKLLNENKIIPLCYDDGLERDFLDTISVPYMLSERNGTVAGTALCFAHSLTNGKIYLCGLDQCPSPSFQHTQPNALEIDNAKKDFRLSTAETRITKSRFNSAAVLEIYRQWFVSNSSRFSKRVFRLSDNLKYDFSLGEISEVNWEDFKKNETVHRESKKPEFIQRNEGIHGEERENLLLNKLREISKTQKFQNEVFPMDTILIKRELSEEKRLTLKSNLEEKTEKLLKDCAKLIFSSKNQAERNLK